MCGHTIWKNPQFFPTKGIIAMCPERPHQYVSTNGGILLANSQNPDTSVEVDRIQSEVPGRAGQLANSIRWFFKTHYTTFQKSLAPEISLLLPEGRYDKEEAKNRFIVERTNAWFKSFRRLRNRFDYTAASFEAFLYWAILVIRMRRLVM